LKGRSFSCAVVGPSFLSSRARLGGRGICSRRAPNTRIQLCDDSRQGTPQSCRTRANKDRALACEGIRRICEVAQPLLSAWFGRCRTRSIPNPHHEAKLVLLVPSRDLPATGSRDVQAHRHKVLRRIAGCVWAVYRQGWRRPIEPLARNKQWRMGILPGVPLPIPKHFLPEAWIAGPGMPQCPDPADR
jgi:hypothetical protein